MAVSTSFETPDLAIATLSGVVTLSDQTAFVAWVRDSIRRTGPVRLLVVLEQFGGWHLPAGAADPALWLRDDEGVSKIAIVGEAAWRASVLTAIAQPVRLLPIEYFQSETAARQWLAGAGSA